MSEHSGDKAINGKVGLLTGLSARLLVLTIAFVMLAELLIWTPSIAQYRKGYLEDRVARAHLAMIAVGSLDAEMVGPQLEAELLYQTGTHGIVLGLSDQRMLMVGNDMPPSVDLVVDMMDTSFLGWIMEAFSTLAQPDNRVLRVLGTTPKNPNISIEVIMDEAPMRAAMLEYSHNILGLSIVISLFTAGLVFVTLQWLMVRPVLRMVDLLARFRRDPEAEATGERPSSRTDEMGVALRELNDMQAEVRAAFRQKTRLATLGSAVAKINHDLRNTLATAVLAFDRLAEIDDPEVKRLSPRLYKAISRAIELCSQTLEYVGASDGIAKAESFHLTELIAEISAEMRDALPPLSEQQDTASMPAFAVFNRVPFEIVLPGDRPQLFRALHNIAVNARQAGANELHVTCSLNNNSCAVLHLRDNGGGIPADVKDRLFEPFASTKDNGTGLGLVIVKDIVSAHDGAVRIADSGPDGTTFEIRLPGARFEAIPDDDA